MDRFDEMRAKTVKVSGDGGSGYNVYVQNSEPESKNGVWIKSDEKTNGTQFLLVGASEGEFVNLENLSEISNNSGTYAFRLLNDYLYLFSTSSGYSRKYNLLMQSFVEGELNVPSVTLTYGLGSLIYNGKIYVFYQNEASIYYYIYDYENNSYTGPTSLGSVRRYNNTNWTSNIVSDGTYAYFISSTYTTSDYYYDICKINLSTMSMSTSQRTGNVFRNNYNITYYNGYIYFTAYSGDSTKTIKALKCDTLAISDLCSVTIGTSRNHYTLCALDGYIYAFESGVSTKNYAKVNVNNKTYELLESDYDIRTNAEASHPDIFHFYETSGILYGFYKYSDTTPSCLAMQVVDNNDYENGTIVISQAGGSSKLVKMIDSSNLYVLITNTFIVKEGKLNGDHVSFYGNGEKWYLIKNPMGETVIVSLSTGETIEVLLGSTITRPDDPVQDGYLFDGWYLNGTEYDFSTPVYEPITLEAKWIEINPTFIDYIESTGTQYIDTGYCAYKTKTEITFQFTSKGSTNQYVMAAWNDNNNRYYPIHFNIETNKINTVNKSNVYIALGDYDTNQHIVIYNDENNKVYFDGIEKATISDLDVQTTNSIYLFAVHGANNSVQECFVGRIMSVKITDKETGTLVRDFKPCKDHNDVYCMYDSITNKYYYNAGTGEFKGSDWQPTTLEYIESTGTQYIDTGIVPKSTTKVETKMMYNTPTGNITQVNGWGSSGNAESFVWGIGSDDNFLISVSTNYSQVYTEVMTDTEPHVFLLESGSQSLDGVVVGTDTIGDTATTGQTMYLLGLHGEWNTSNAVSLCKAKLYYCKIYDGGTLVRDYIPALDDNGVVCLYDRVSDTFFYNKGSGSFIAG